MHIPAATYRIQFNRAFDFGKATEIISYLAGLGISDLYASPIFKAKRGSLHGYDGVDPNRLNPELGKSSDLEALSAELKKYKMGWIQDIVPNHLAFDYENTMLMDVLENGQDSEYYVFFDIDWDHWQDNLNGRVLAPFLGKYYGESLEAGEILLEFGAPGFTVNYFDVTLPLKIESYFRLLARPWSQIKTKLRETHPDAIKFREILQILKKRPAGEEKRQRCDRIKTAKNDLWQLYNENREVKKAVDASIRRFNGRKGDLRSYEAIDDLLSEQLYALSFWRTAGDEVNYRRFFHLNDLICLKTENDTVFNHIHTLIFKLIEKEIITGLRIDHIDGLYDPARYLKKLREKTGDVYICVEKILGFNEELAGSWPVQGTTGYDFMNVLNGVFCQKENDETFSKIYWWLIGHKSVYGDILYESKKHVVENHMRGDLNNLVNLVKKISAGNRYGKDLTFHRLKSALKEILVRFPVYRSYETTEDADETARTYIRSAVEAAKQHHPELEHELGFLQKLLLLDFESDSSDHKTARQSHEKDQRIQFLMKFQQITAPLMAKGFEDTALYVYNRLLSLNEVGGRPDEFGLSLEAFHEFQQRRAIYWPNSLNATSTHDTKRGEDTRARINVLSELPGEWKKMLDVWGKWNRGKKETVKGVDVPDKNEEYFIYQTLIGAFPFDRSRYPFFVERMKEHAVKALREAKIHTSWHHPNSDYEKACVSFIDKILNLSGDDRFLTEFLPFFRKVSFYGIFNSLSQVLVKITSPGIPDFYQGSELWDFNLVDPDNRRPVDFEKRKMFLKAICGRNPCRSGELLSDLLRERENGKIKLFLTYIALKARKENPEIFLTQNYIPLKVIGSFKEHIIAFARPHKQRWGITIAPRLLVALTGENQYPLGEGIWRDTQVILPEGAPPVWKNIITSEIFKNGSFLSIGRTLHRFPVALLMSEEAI
jgi:(1->4)-alpha-D-glucan 1-alpha-D-glucosylmutase